MTDDKRKQMDGDAMVEWVKANTRHESTGEAVKACRWFVSCRLADDFIQTVKLRDVANMIMSGLQIHHIDEMDDVDQWLLDLNDGAFYPGQGGGGPDAITYDDVAEWLKEHFQS